MSRCPACLQGLCRKHPLQDHGERASKLQEQAASSRNLSQSSSLSLIQSQIEKLQNAAKGTTEREQDLYRLQIEQDRKQAEKRKRRVMSSEEFQLANNTGLHGSVLSAMMAHSDEDDSLSGSSVASSEKSREKKSKKDSKKRKEKKDKKDKKSRKKKEKSKKHKKSRTDSDQQQRLSPHSSDDSMSDR